jgi:hypothetical protein
MRAPIRPEKFDRPTERAVKLKGAGLNRIGIKDVSPTCEREGVMVSGGELGNCGPGDYY